MGSHQCEFLSDDRGHEQWQRCGEIHRNLLYVLYGSADPDAGTLGFLLENVSYNTLFPYALFFSLMAFLTMTQVRHGDVKAQKKESILENFDVDD